VRSGFELARCSGARPFRDHAVLPKRWRTYARVGVGCTRRPPRRRSVAAKTKGPRSIPSESTRRKRKGIATWVPGCGRLLALRQSGRYSRADALNRPPRPRPAWVTALVTGCKHLVKSGFAELLSGKTITRRVQGESRSALDEGLTASGTSRRHPPTATRPTVQPLV
jgi:hypothetical protein